MTVSSLNTKNLYNGDGSATSFAYQFPIHSTAELTVIERAATGTETIKSLGSHYSITDNGAAGGNVVFSTAPASGVTVVLLRNTNLTQEVDYIENDAFPAETHEAAIDKLTLQIQEAQEELDRSIKLSRTNTITSTEFTVGSAARAGKMLGFDNSGELSVTQEIGSNRGNWAASTAYAVRDIVKDTSTNNIFMAKTAHTSSGSQPITTNTDSAKWDLLVDAATATTSATNAASSATAAANSASGVAASATAAASSASTAATHKTAAETAKTAAETAKTAAQTAQTAAEAALDTFDDRFLGAKSSDPSVDNDGNALIDGAIYFNTTTDVMNVYDLTNTQWRQLALTGTNQTNVNTVAGQISPTNNLATVAGANSNITTLAGLNTEISALNGISAAITGVNNISAAVSAVNSNATNINAVNTNKTNIDTLAGISNLGNLANAHAAVSNVNTNLQAVQNFADVYRIASSAPTSSLNAGDLYFDTTADELKVYKSGGWAAAGSTVNGTANRFIYNITGTPTTLSGASGTGYAEASSKTLAYDAGFIDTYVNGVKQILGTDYTATSGSSIVFAAALAASDVVDIVAYGTFQLANISINQLTDTPASIGSAGQALIVNPAGNALTYAAASSAEVYGFEQYFSPSTSTFTVTVQSVGGSNKYFIDGVQQNTLDLYEGNTYIFNYPSGHPFKFSTTSNGTHASGSEYTTGVTHNSSTQVTLVVASGAPTLYYYCSSHSNMGGTANTPVPGNNSLRIRTTNQGADNITGAEYAAFSDVMFSASGFVFSLNASGNLIATV